MNTQVKVTANNGQVITVSKNPQWGFIRVEQRRLIHGEDGFVRPRNVSALIQGEVSVLKEFGYKAGQLITGKIVIQESLTPFNKDPDEAKRDIKIAGETGIVCSVEGQPIYRRHIYDDANRFEESLIQHDNVQEIKEAFELLAKQKDNAEEGKGKGDKSLTNP